MIYVIEIILIALILLFVISLNSIKLIYLLKFSLILIQSLMECLQHILQCNIFLIRSSHSNRPLYLIMSNLLLHAIILLNISQDSICSSLRICQNSINSLLTNNIQCQSQVLFEVLNLNRSILQIIICDNQFAILIITILDYIEASCSITKCSITRNLIIYSILISLSLSCHNILHCYVTSTSSSCLIVIVCNVISLLLRSLQCLLNTRDTICNGLVIRCEIYQLSSRFTIDKSCIASITKVLCILKSLLHFQRIIIESLDILCELSYS